MYILCDDKLKSDSLKVRKLKTNKWSTILQVSLNGHHVRKANLQEHSIIAEIGEYGLDFLSGKEA